MDNLPFSIGDTSPELDAADPQGQLPFSFSETQNGLTLIDSAKRAAQDFSNAAFTSADWLTEGVELITKGLLATAKGVGSVVKGSYDWREEVSRQELIDFMNSWKFTKPSEVARSLGVSEEWLHNWVTQGANEMLQKGLEITSDVGGAVSDVTGSPATGAISKALLDILLLKKAHDVAAFPLRKLESVVEGRADKKASKDVSEDVYDAEAAKTDALVDELVGRPAGSRKGPLDDTSPEGTIPFEKSGMTMEGIKVEPTMPTRPRRLDPNEMFFTEPDLGTGLPPIEKAARRGGPEITEGKTAFQGARFEEGATLGREGFTKEPLTLDPMVEPRWKGDEVVDTSRAPELGFEGKQLPIDFNIDPLHERGRLAMNKPGFLRDADELMASRYYKKSEGIEEPKPAGQTAAGKGQRGSVDFGLEELVVKSAKAIGRYIKNFQGKATSTGEPIVPAPFFSGSDKLPKEVRDIIPDTRPIETVIESSLGKKIKDMGILARNLMTESNLLTWYKDNPIFKSTVDRTVDINNRYDRLNETLREGEVLGSADSSVGKAISSVLSPNIKSRLIRKEAGPIGYMDNLPKTAQANVWKTIHRYDDAQILHDRGLMWPTRDMLKADGLTPKEIKAYELYARLTDNLYDIINHARNLISPKLGNVRRIPGYFPHLYKGSWFFELRDIKTGKPVFFTRTTSKRNAAKLWKQLQKKAKTDPEAAKIIKDSYLVEPQRIENATEISSMVAAFEKTLEVLDNKHWANPYIKKMMSSIESSIAAGVIPHTLSRTLNLRGYMGDSLSKDVFSAKESRDAFVNYINAVTEYAKKIEIQKFVEEPLRANKDTIVNKLKLPETYQYLERTINAYKGTPTNFLDPIDRTIEKMVDKIPGIGGGSGHPVRTALRKIRNFFTTKAIGFYNPVYLAGNIIQPHFMGIPVMAREAARLGKGNAYLEALKIDLNTLDVPGFRPSKEHMWVATRGAKEKVVTPNLMENIDFSWTTNKVGAKEKLIKGLTGRYAAEHVEAVGRLKTLLYAYEVYKSAGLPREAAYQAAKGRVDEIMMNYDKVKRPRFYQDMGLVGEAMSPFAVFAHGQLGNFIITLKAIKENKGAINKLKPVITQQVVGLMSAGLMGVIGIAELEYLMRGLNAVLASTGSDLDFGSPTEWMLKYGHKIPDVLGGQSTANTLSYGVPSEMTKAVPGLEAGANVGSLMKAPVANELVGAAGVEWMTKIFSEAGPAAWRLMMQNGTKNDFYTLIKETFLPNWMAGSAERMQAIEYGQIKRGTRQSNLDVFIPREGEPTSVAPNTFLGGKGNAPRDAADWRVRMYTGKRSLAEEDYLAASRIEERNAMRDKESLTRLVDIAADYVSEGNPVPDVLFKKAIEKQVLPYEFRKMIDSRVSDRRTGRIGRKLGTKPTLKNLEKMRRLRELGQ